MTYKHSYNLFSYAMRLPFWNEKCDILTGMLPDVRERKVLEIEVTTTVPKQIIRTRKVKLNPTREQKEKLRMFAGSVRFTYNAVIAAIRENKIPATKIAAQNTFAVAKTQTGEYTPFISKYRWLNKTPAVIRQQAAFEAAIKYKAEFEKFKKTGQPFDMRFKSLKQQRQHGFSIGVTKQLKCVDGVLKIMPREIGTMRYFGKMPFEGVPPAECRIQRDRHGDHWLLVPIKLTPKAPRKTWGTVAAIDPGVTNPFALFGSDGSAKMYGIEMQEKLAVLRAKKVCLDRRISLAPARSGFKRKLMMFRRLLFRQIKRIRDDAHWNIISEMTNTYDGVLLPALGIQQIAQFLKPKANARLLDTSHYIFRERLRGKCEEKGLLFCTPSEEYTSKTCDFCGVVKDDLTLKDRTFHCGNCGRFCDRDIHAARNILLKWLSSEGYDRV